MAFPNNFETKKVSFVVWGLMVWGPDKCWVFSFLKHFPGSYYAPGSGLSIEDKYTLNRTHVLTIKEHMVKWKQTCKQANKYIV